MDGLCLKTTASVIHGIPSTISAAAALDIRTNQSLRWLRKPRLLGIESTKPSRSIQSLQTQWLFYFCRVLVVLEGRREDEKTTKPNNERLNSIQGPRTRKQSFTN
ncbi:hypothetical protein L3X38_045519 [Prunus dulcis]|uniref:Uncharacterized protein n=1 Tax=Prunus dulcis TaxID=3755 RepID=A0AAD4USD6_PRUDU|nr:hypothetical protein L3X38_045519 [Prunus dulcis]